GGDVVKEANLARHLVNPDLDDATPAAEVIDAPGDDEDDPEDSDQPLAERDYELYEALNMLKGMHMLRQRSAAP
ncbi:MAG: peptidase S41, partial [Gammaproteobacteria bacterium]